ncbi:MAG: thioredoxin family protein [Planctomycetota bacterium]|nr:thioredoxin family protein [Planctomycetota bacterium]
MRGPWIPGAACAAWFAAMAVYCLAAEQDATKEKGTDPVPGWNEQAWKEMLPEGVLLDAEGEPASLNRLKGKIVGIYFSAHWCPPCRAFTPKLVEFRDKNADRFEVVFVSSDRSEKDQFNYIKETGMKWTTVKFKSPAADALKKKFDVAGIPKLVILAPSGDMISEQGRAEVTSAPDKCLEKWIAKAREKAGK